VFDPCSYCGRQAIARCTGPCNRLLCELHEGQPEAAAHQSGWTERVSKFVREQLERANLDGLLCRECMTAEAHRLAATLPAMPPLTVAPANLLESTRGRLVDDYTKAERDDLRERAAKAFESNPAFARALAAAVQEDLETRRVIAPGDAVRIKLTSYDGHSTTHSVIGGDVHTSFVPTNYDEWLCNGQGDLTIRTIRPRWLIGPKVVERPLPPTREVFDALLHTYYYKSFRA